MLARTNEPAADIRSPRSAGKGGDGDLVPSRRQYLELKAQHPGTILLYRLGDFYETFDDDAVVVARDARITLTTRSFGRNGRVPMAGIPHHALNHYLVRLLAHGHAIAITEQVGEPGRGLVEREVTRVLTPGTVAESALLPAGENRYLAAVAEAGDRIGLAWVDVSTGEFAAIELTGDDARARLTEELTRLNPAECLVADDAPESLPSAGHRTRLERWHFRPDRARDALTEHFRTRSLAAFGGEERPAAVAAAGAALAYVGRTNPRLLALLTGLRVETPGRRVGLDPATRRNLELTRSHRTGGSRGSLLGALDLTVTAMGARALRRLLGEPLRDLPELRRRQAFVADLVRRPDARAAAGAALARIGDIERLAGKIAGGGGTARDALALASALRGVAALAERLAAAGPALRARMDDLDRCPELLIYLETAVEEGEDGVARIRDGFSAELDAAVAGVRDTRRWLAELEGRERERTGIRSLKVGFNKVFGYYIEVTRPNLSLVPAEFVRKQTVAGGERYVTAALKDAEARALAADEEIAALERAALARLAARVAAEVGRLFRAGNAVAELDAFLALAETAARHDWVAPDLEEGDALVIQGGRHPVVEASLGGDPFIPNDCRLGGDAPRALVVSGPNMGGKSTYLRQVALIVLLAQIGSFVPARAARIGLADRIFTRIGAHDDLAGGNSTFMVEMVETASILHQATERSLVILDEVGRGTSTGDGLAIARAVFEDLHDRVRARTLFATHYLELAAVAEGLPMGGNAHVAALERDGKVVFLYAVRPGAADRAYGIHVARIAGLPPHVADRAEAILADGAPLPLPAPEPYPASPIVERRVAELPPDGQLALDGFPQGPDAAIRLARALRELDPSALTPREAIDWLFAQRERL